MKGLISWSNATNRDRAEVVFENRNKDYGAYQIRVDYEKKLIAAALITLAVVILTILVPTIVGIIQKATLRHAALNTEVVTLAEPPPIDKTAPPPPPAVPPPPIQKTIQFTPPKVVKDEEIVEPAPTQEQVKDVVISTKTQEGTSNVDLPPENPVVDKGTGEPFTWVQEMPKFPGGEQKLLEYIQKHINYPAVARENGIQGRVTVRFVVDENGKVKSANIPKGMGIGGGCDEEATRVIMTMPDWNPGKQNGHAVPVWYTVPVIFKLQ